jgi:hypothetical protein
MRWLCAGLLVLGALFLYEGRADAQADEAVEIVINSSGFSPNSATVPFGQGAYWCNDDTAVHSVAFDNGPTSPDLQPEDCTDDIELEPGTYPYHDGHHAETVGVITFEAPSTTTTIAGATTVASGPTTTVRVTTTTRRTSTTRLVIRKSATTRPPSTTSSTSLETTTSFFDTTTSENTSTTFGTFAIQETGDGGSNALPLVLSGAVILGGAGYLGYRYRYRFLR